MPDEQSMQPMQAMQSAEPMHSMDPMQAMNGHEAVGHLYTQTNELRNSVIHYRRTANGTIESAPNAFEVAGRSRRGGN